MSDFILEANELSKKFEDREALRNVTVNVRPNEIVSVLGTKNSGKTTILRILAGFEVPTSGSILSNGKSITRKPPHKRSISSVFADSILFPDMTILQNLAYPLKIRGFSSSQIRELTSNMLDITELKGTEKKFPHDLTTVQYKRALIARAAICTPDVLLLDEPFASFLSSERTSAAKMIKVLKKELGIAIVCATADPEIAMQISDRVFIIRSGRTEQAGPPSYLYSKPRTTFTANILGKANIIKGHVSSANEFIAVDTGNSSIALYNNNYKVKLNTPVTICIRPEDIRLSTRPVGNSIKGAIVEQTFSTASTTIRIKSVNTEIYHTMTGMSRFDDGDIVYAEFDPHKAILIDIPE